MFITAGIEINFLTKILFIFRERGRRGKRERNIDV